MTNEFKEALNILNKLAQIDISDKKNTNISSDYAAIRNEIIFNCVVGAKSIIEIFKNFNSDEGTDPFYRLFYNATYGDPEENDAKPQDNTEGREKLKAAKNKIKNLLEALDNECNNNKYYSANALKLFNESLAPAIDKETEDKVVRKPPELTQAERRAAILRGHKL